MVYRRKQKSRPGDVESALPAISSRTVDVVISARYDFLNSFINSSAPSPFPCLCLFSFLSLSLFFVSGEGDSWVPLVP